MMKLTLRPLLLALMVLFLAKPADAQMFEPVKWTMKLEVSDDGKLATVILTARIDHGWHMYSHLVNPETGPTPLTLDWTELEGVRLKGALTSEPQPTVKYDEMFGSELSWWASKAQLRQQMEVTGQQVSIKGTLRYQVCDDSNCLPPAKLPVELHARVAGASAAVPEPAVADSAAGADSIAATPLPADSAAAGAASGPAAPGETLGSGVVRWCRRRISRRLHLSMVDFLHMLPRGLPGTPHTLCMAHDTADRQLLPQAERFAQLRHRPGRHLWALHRGDIRASGHGGDPSVRSELAQRAIHKRRLQHHFLPAACGVCRVVLRSV